MKILTRCTAALVLALFSLQVLSAQTIVGLKAGYNSNNVYATEALGTILPDFDNLNAFQYGVFADVPVAGGFSVQSEVLFTKKGFGAAQGFEAPLFGVDIPIGVTAETQFNYVDVPLLAKYAFGTGPVQAYVAAGPTFGYATSGQIVTRANLLVDIALGRTDLDLDAIDYNRFEVGGAIGAGVQADLGSFRAFADARYNRGFTELYNIPVVNERVRNEGFAITAGIGIPLQR